MKKLTKKEIDEMMKLEDTTDREHTELSASWAKIWLHCTKAVELSKTFPNIDEAGDYALEGTTAHFLAEMLLKNKITLEQLPVSFEQLSEYYTCVKQIQGIGNLLVEVKVDMTKLLNSSTPIYGRSDAVVLAPDGGIDIIDLKWGKGITVSAYDNEQLKLYAIGTIHFLDTLGLLDENTLDENTRITLHIVQPRIEESGYTYYNMTAKKLFEFAAFVRKRLIQISNKDLVFDKGEHCQFCKGKSMCPMFTKSTELAVADSKKDITTISQDKLIALWNAKADVLAFYKALEKYIKAQIVSSKDGTFNGYKLSIIDGKRVVVDEEALIAQFVKAGCPESTLHEISLISISAIDKLAKKYNIDKDKICGIEKNKKENIVPVVDAIDTVFSEEK